MNLSELLFSFTYYYPLFMSYLWMIGAVFYYFHYEKNHSATCIPPKLDRYPKVSLVVPCYNEEDNARETITNLLNHNYPNFEVIAINDGSKDNTMAILDQMLLEYPDKLKVIHQAKNQGKAVGLNTAAAISDAEFMLCIDGDALLDCNAANWMVWHFLKSPRVGIVTGNPRIRNRSSLLGRLQVGEFSSIIGIIKRAQRTYGRIFSVSGVVACFRKTALHQVGYWSKDMLTEDIDISWKMQMNHWDVRFEPAALCWILMPETLTGLWKQRLRWAMGGVQTLMKYSYMWTDWKKRRMWPVYLEYCISIVWAYVMVGSIILFLIGLIIPLPEGLHVETLFPGWTGVVIAVTCLIQIVIGMWLDRNYDKRFYRHFFVAIWYPFVFWFFGMLTSFWSVPKAIFRQKGKRAVWVSPDRGIASQK